MAEPIQIGILLYPNVTQLDATGPAQVLSRVPGAKLHMIWKTRDPVPTDAGFSIVPTTTFADCPQLDVICVPGGGGQVEVMVDAEALEFLRKQAAKARYVTSVCTGSLILGAAGLLKGYKSACHWAWRDMLKDFGAIPVAERVVRDRNRISGGGVTAGIDFGLTRRRRAGRRGSRQVDPARARVRSAAAVRFGLARKGRRRKGQAHPRAAGAPARKPPQGQCRGGGAARLRRCVRAAPR